jgi:micrococcal nuclease
VTTLKNRAAVFFPVLAILISIIVCSCGSDAAGAGAYLVTRAVDGDTVIIDMDGTEERVRLIGVDTPESVHPDSDRNVPYGEIASEFTKDKLEGKRVGIELDAQERDRYGRLLAYVYIGGEMFNETLLSEGHAVIATYPPNVRYADKFALLQEDARERGVGLWALYADDATDQKDDAGAEQVDGLRTGDPVNYIGNTGTKKFHLPSCRYVSSIKEDNIARFSERGDAIAAGLEACKVCNP